MPRNKGSKDKQPRKTRADIGVPNPKRRKGYDMMLAKLGPKGIKKRNRAGGKIAGIIAGARLASEVLDGPLDESGNFGWEIASQMALRSWELRRARGWKPAPSLKPKRVWLSRLEYLAQERAKKRAIDEAHIRGLKKKFKKAAERGEDTTPLLLRIATAERTIAGGDMRA